MEADTEMPVEIARPLWLPVTLQIGWRGPEQQLEWAQAPHHQARIREIPTTHRGIDALVDQIDEAIVEIEVYLDFRIARHEWGGRARLPAERAI